MYWGVGSILGPLIFLFVIIKGDQQEQRAARREDVDENPRLSSNRNPEAHDHHRSDRIYVLDTMLIEFIKVLVS